MNMVRTPIGAPGRSSVGEAAVAELGAKRGRSDGACSSRVQPCGRLGVLLKRGVANVAIGDTNEGGVRPARPLGHNALALALDDRRAMAESTAISVVAVR